MKRIFYTLMCLCFTFGSLSGCESKKEPENTYADKYIELHAHLDGAITVEIAKKLAALQRIELPTEDDSELEKLLRVPDDCRDLNQFLECFELPVSLLQTYKGLEEAAYLVCEDMYKNGVIYAELRYAPQLHCTNGMTQEDSVKAVLSGCERSSLKTNIILCCMRGEGNDAENRETVETAKKYLVEDGGVVALDIAGAEALYPTYAYKELFAYASENGIPFTIHAGEADGAESVKLAIEYGAQRIGHGVRAGEDEKVLALAKEKGVFFEMCPTSNLQTCAVYDIKDYPIIDYLNYGIGVTLNSDDPAIEGITLEHEYRLLEKELGLTPEQEKKLLANSVDAAFTSDEIKSELKLQLGLS